MRSNVRDSFFCLFLFLTHHWICQSISFVQVCDVPPVCASPKIAEIAPSCLVLHLFFTFFVLCVVHALLASFGLRRLDLKKQDAVGVFLHQLKTAGTSFSQLLQKSNLEGCIGSHVTGHLKLPVPSCTCWLRNFLALAALLAFIVCPPLLPNRPLQPSVNVVAAVVERSVTDVVVDYSVRFRV